MSTHKLAYTLAEAADLTGVSPDLLKAAKDSGTLRCKRTSVNRHGEPSGRILFLRADLEAWLEQLVDG